MNQLIKRAFCAVVFTFFCIGQSHAATILDATVWGYFYDYAHNHSTSIPHTFDYDGRTQSVLVVSDPGGSFSKTESRGTIEFDISSLTDPMATSTLNLTKDYANFTSSVTFSVYGETNWRANGSFGSSDYYPGPTLAAQSTYFNEATLDFDVTDFINSAIAADKDWVLFQIIHTAGFQNGTAMFNNATGGAVGGGIQPPPTLELTAVPLPAAIWLLGSGLIGMVGIRRKFRK